MSGKVKKYQEDKKPLMTEISTQTSHLYSGYALMSFNPDDLVGKKGLQIYAKMMQDDQVKAVLTMKKYARLSTPWYIIPASNDPIDKEVADFVKFSFQNLEGTFENNLLNIYTALEFGFSITELVYQIINKGRFAGKIGLKSLKTREPYNYDFDFDKHGNLKPDGIVFQATERYPIEKFVIYSYNKEFSNWYGKSDLRSAYRSWFSKEILIRFYNMYLERFGMPTVKGVYKKGTPEEQVKKLRDILSNIQSRYSITIPEDITVDLLQAGGGDAAFRSAIEMHNKFIARSVLVPDMIGYTESTGGSYSLGKKQFDVFLWILRELGRDTEEGIVGEQIIRKLVDYNYDVEKYPSFQFESITEEDTEAKARIVRLGVDGGFIDPTEPWVRPYLSLPEPAEGAQLGRPKTIEGAPAGLPQPGGKAPATGVKGSPAGDQAVPTEDLWVSALAPNKMSENSNGHKYMLKVYDQMYGFNEFSNLYEGIKKAKELGLKGETQIEVIGL